MFGKSKTKKRKKAKRGRPGFSILADPKRRRLGGVALGLVVILAFVWAAGSAVSRLEAHVQRQIESGVDDATLAFIDLPDGLVDLASAELHDAVSDILSRPWTDAAICRDMATRLGSVGWVAKIHFVRRSADAQFEVSADYRLPVAMVQHGDDFILVDGAGVRLPGAYRYAPAWMIVQGVRHAPPEPGVAWPGDDLRAGLKVIQSLRAEPYHIQITGVLVDNVGGRVDPTRCHIELATDRAGGRIRWGSAPGMEIEENSVGQKVAILRANYRDTGRADAHHSVIDVSTFPDRFIIPG